MLNSNYREHIILCFHEKKSLFLPFFCLRIFRCSSLSLKPSIFLFFLTTIIGFFWASSISNSKESYNYFTSNSSSPEDEEFTTFSLPACSVYFSSSLRKLFALLSFTKVGEPEQWDSQLPPWKAPTASIQKHLLGCRQTYIGLLKVSGQIESVWRSGGWNWLELRVWGRVPPSAFYKQDFQKVGNIKRFWTRIPEKCTGPKSTREGTKNACLYLLLSVVGKGLAWEHGHPQHLRADGRADFTWAKLSNTYTVQGKYNPYLAVGMLRVFI